jgi:hypothetical protein
MSLLLLCLCVADSVGTTVSSGLPVLCSALLGSSHRPSATLAYLIVWRARLGITALPLDSLQSLRCVLPGTSAAEARTLQPLFVFLAQVSLTQAEICVQQGTLAR